MKNVFKIKGPAVGCLETNSIAKGIEASDAMLKMSDVTLAGAAPFSKGKYYVLVSGVLADVEQSMNAGADVLGKTLIRRIVIPNIHRKVVDTIGSRNDVQEIEAVGIVETATVISIILAADEAVKAADVELIEIAMGRGIGGKGFFTLTGEVGAVRSAMAAATAKLEEGELLSKVIIPYAHKGLLESLSG